jgi:hypothetical protein
LKVNVEKAKEIVRGILYESGRYVDVSERIEISNFEFEALVQRKEAKQKKTNEGLGAK